MTHPEYIGPVTVTRDRNGFWTHPHYFTPASDEATRAEFGDWMHRHNLTCATRWMENDAPPQVIAAWEKGARISVPGNPQRLRAMAGLSAPFMTRKTARSVSGCGR